MTFLNKIKKTLSNLTTGEPQFDPTTIGDDLALRISWTPAENGGTNFGTHRLIQVSSSRIEFKARGVALLLPGIFMAVGIAVAIGMTIGGLRQDITMLYFGIPFGAVFFLVGFFILRSWMLPRVFDRNAGYYWKGKKEPKPIGMPEIKQYCRLKQIYAIQLIQEYCRSSSSNGGSSSYYSYELNLVFKDGQRLNVVDHGNKFFIIEDAQTLAKFLHIPVWNGITQ